MADQALIFDCDGTLADTMPAHFRCWTDVLDAHGIPFPEARFYALGGKPTIDIARLLFSECGKETDLEAFCRLKEEKFLTHLESVQPIAKVVEIARRHRGELPMAVASGGHRKIVQLTLAQIGVAEWFPVVVGAEDVTHGKPAPDVFLEAARRLGADPSHCTVYEDTELGIEAARRAGMRWVDIRRL